MWYDSPSLSLALSRALAVGHGVQQMPRAWFLTGVSVRSSPPTDELRSSVGGPQETKPTTCKVCKVLLGQLLWRRTRLVVA